jgi:hypothetical protein
MLRSFHVYELYLDVVNELKVCYKQLSLVTADHQTVQLTQQP